MMFEQQLRESDKAFAAFKEYLDMGAERSAQAVAKKLAKSRQLVGRWSSRYRWSERVQAHAAHMATVERVAAEEAVRAKAAVWADRQDEHKEEEWTLRGQLIAASRKVLEKFIDGSRGATLGDVARALELASKLGRLSSRMPTETVEQKTEVDVNFRIEVEAAVKKAYGEVIDVEVVPEPRKELNDARP